MPRKVRQALILGFAFAVGVALGLLVKSGRVERPRNEAPQIDFAAPVTLIRSGGVDDPPIELRPYAISADGQSRAIGPPPAAGQIWVLNFDNGRFIISCESPVAK